MKENVKRSVGMNMSSMPPSRLTLFFHFSSKFAPKNGFDDEDYFPLAILETILSEKFKQ